MGAAILCSMPSFAAQLARVQAVRTRVSRVAAHWPALHLASCLIRPTELRALWLHVWQCRRHRETDSKNPLESQNDSMRLYEDIDTTGGMEDMSKAQRVKSMLHVRTKVNRRSFDCQKRTRAENCQHDQTIDLEILFSILSYLMRTQC